MWLGGFLLWAMGASVIIPPFICPAPPIGADVTASEAAGSLFGQPKGRRLPLAESGLDRLTEWAGASACPVGPVAGACGGRRIMAHHRTNQRCACRACVCVPKAAR